MVLYYHNLRLSRYAKKGRMQSEVGTIYYVAPEGMYLLFLSLICICLFIYIYLLLPRTKYQEFLLVILLNFTFANSTIIENITITTKY